MKTIINRLAVVTFAIVFALVCNAQAYQSPTVDGRQSTVIEEDQPYSLLNIDRQECLSYPAIVEPRARAVIVIGSAPARRRFPLINRQPAKAAFPTHRDRAPKEIVLRT